MARNQAESGKHGKTGRNLYNPKAGGRASRRNMAKRDPNDNEDFSDGINLTACGECGLWGCGGWHIPPGPTGGD